MRRADGDPDDECACAHKQGDDDGKDNPAHAGATRHFLLGHRAENHGVHVFDRPAHLRLDVASVGACEGIGGVVDKDLDGVGEFPGLDVVVTVAIGFDFGGDDEGVPELSTFFGDAFEEVFVAGVLEQRWPDVILEAVLDEGFDADLLRSGAGAVFDVVPSGLFDFSQVRTAGLIGGDHSGVDGEVSPLGQRRAGCALSGWERVGEGRRAIGDVGLIDHAQFHGIADAAEPSRAGLSLGGVGDAVVDAFLYCGIVEVEAIACLGIDGDASSHHVGRDVELMIAVAQPGLMDESTIELEGFQGAAAVGLETPLEVVDGIAWFDSLFVEVVESHSTLGVVGLVIGKANVEGVIVDGGDGGRDEGAIGFLVIGHSDFAACRPDELLKLSACLEPRIELQSNLLRVLGVGAGLFRGIPPHPSGELIELLPVVGTALAEARLREQLPIAHECGGLVGDGNAEDPALVDARLPDVIGGADPHVGLVMTSPIVFDVIVEWEDKPLGAILRDLAAVEVEDVGGDAAGDGEELSPPGGRALDAQWDEGPEGDFGVLSEELFDDSPASGVDGVLDCFLGDVPHVQHDVVLGSPALRLRMHRYGHKNHERQDQSPPELPQAFRSTKSAGTSAHSLSLHSDALIRVSPLAVEPVEGEDLNP